MHCHMFTPKFHPELNFIERAWRRAKWFLRLFCDYSFPGLKSRLAVAMGLVKMSTEQRKSHERLKESDYVLTKRISRSIHVSLASMLPHTYR